MMQNLIMSMEDFRIMDLGMDPPLPPEVCKARDWNSIGAGDGFRVLKHPTKNIIYSEMQGAENVWRIDVDRRLSKTIQPQPTKGIAKLTVQLECPYGDKCTSARSFLYGKPVSSQIRRYG